MSSQFSVIVPSGGATFYPARNTIGSGTFIETGSISLGYFNGSLNVDKSGNGWGSTTPASAFADFPGDARGPQIQTLAIGYVSVSFGSPDFPGDPWQQSSVGGSGIGLNFCVILSGIYPQNYFTDVNEGRNNLDYVTATADYYSTTLYPGCTAWVWHLQGNPSAPAGTAIPYTFNNLVVPTYPRIGSLEWEAPVIDTGAFDDSTASINITWTAGADGYPQRFVPGDTAYIVDPSASHIHVDAALGGGGGGGGGESANGPARFGAGSPGAGGAWAIGDMPVGMFATQSTIPITVGAKGTGSISYPIGPDGFTLQANGLPGGTTTLGPWLTANGGQGGFTNEQITHGTSVAVGGTWNTIGMLSVQGENGAQGASAWGNGQGNPDPRPGVSTTNSGASGGGGAVSAALCPGGSVANGGTGGLMATVGDGPGSPGTDSPTGLTGGGGGGGGGSANSVSGPRTAGRGGNGGYPAGGGGGGGWDYVIFAPNGPTDAMSGPGGDGGDGTLVIRTFWYHAHDAQYLVYREGVLIGTTAQGATGFTDHSPHPGTNHYEIKMTYDGVTPGSAFSNVFPVDTPNLVVNSSGRFVPGPVFKAIEITNLDGIKPRIFRPKNNTNIRSK